MCRRLFLAALLVSLSSAFSPIVRTTTSDGHLNAVTRPFHTQKRVPPCFVQTSLDESAASTSPQLPEFTFPESTVEHSLLLSKIVNAAFLLAAFSYALYAILNIDHGMTRGWTQSEIAMRIPLDNWSSYEAALLEKPIMTKTVINVIIYLLGDWLSQTVFQKKNILDFDIARTLRNGFIGLCFGPLVHQYYEFSDQILPVEGGLVNRASKILMDQTVYLTVKCSIYISAVGLLGGDDWPTVQSHVKERIGPVVLTAWKFWPLVHCITYGLIPARHRILWVNCVDLVWNAILARKAQGDDTNNNKEEEEELEQFPQDKPWNMMERVTTADNSEPNKQVFEANIQAELQEILASSPEEIVLDTNSLNTSNTNTTVLAPVTT